MICRGEVWMFCPKRRQRSPEHSQLLARGCAADEEHTRTAASAKQPAKSLFADEFILFSIVDAEATVGIQKDPHTHAVDEHVSRSWIDRCERRLNRARILLQQIESAASVGALPWPPHNVTVALRVLVAIHELTDNAKR